MNRFVAVVGPGRCGSSLVAGMLHEAGVSMGKDLIGPHPEFNPWGHFEDKVTHRINRITAHVLCNDPALVSETVGRYPQIADFEGMNHNFIGPMYKALVRSLEVDGYWGMKCVMLGLVWPYIKRHFPEDRRIIHVERNRDQIIASRMRHSGLDYDEAERLTAVLWNAAHRMAREAPVGTATQVNYEDILANPREEARRILQHVTGQPSGEPLDIEAAVAHVKKGAAIADLHTQHVQ